MINAVRAPGLMVHRQLLTQIYCIYRANKQLQEAH